jgi:hypothetical protein
LIKDADVHFVEGAKTRPYLYLGPAGLALLAGAACGGASAEVPTAVPPAVQSAIPAVSATAGALVTQPAGQTAISCAATAASRITPPAGLAPTPSPTR